MQSPPEEKTCNLSVADISVKLIVKILPFFRYLQEEYFCSKGNKRPAFYLTIQEDNKTFQLVGKNKKIYTFSKKRIRSWRDLDYLVNSYIAHKLLRENTILLHGSSVVAHRRGFVFIGPSGIGKTTVIQKVRKSMVLSDDTAVVKKERGKYYLYSSPFDKRFVVSGDRKRVELGTIFVLEQSQVSGNVSLSERKKIEHIMLRNIYYHYPFSYSVPRQKTTSILFSLIGDLINHVTIVKLRLTKNATIEPFLI